MRDRQWLEDGFEKMLKCIAAAKPGRESNVTGNDRPDREDDQWNRHGFWRFVDVRLRMMIHSRIAEKCHEDQAEHVERRHSRHAGAQKPQQNMSLLAGKRLPENFILREKARQARRA